MKKPKHTPHVRLKALRKIIGGVTQERFAKKIGISYPYFLAIETGQRPLSEALARRISCTTGIDSSWLLGKGSETSPVDLAQRAFTAETYSALNKPMPQANEGHFAAIHDQSHYYGEEIFACFRIAYRRSYGAGLVSMAMLEEAIKKMKETLRITEREFAEEMAHIQSQWPAPDYVLKLIEEVEGKSVSPRSRRRRKA